MITTDHPAAPQHRPASDVTVGELLTWQQNDKDTAQWGPVIARPSAVWATVWVGPTATDVIAVHLEGGAEGALAQAPAIMAAETDEHRAQQVQGLALHAQSVAARLDTQMARTQELVAERHRLHARHAAEAAEARRAAIAVREQTAGELLTDYKARVRRRAFEVAAENGHCVTGLNETLTELELAPYDDERARMTRTMTVTVSCSATVEVVHASTLAQALQWAEENITVVVMSDDDDVSVVGSPVDVTIATPRDDEVVVTGDEDAVATGYAK